MSLVSSLHLKQLRVYVRDPATSRMVFTIATASMLQVAQKTEKVASCRSQGLPSL
jgi:hypothetical protein